MFQTLHDSSAPTDPTPGASRRGFLKAMIAGAAGMVLISCDTAQEAPSPETETKVLRVGWGGTVSNLDPAFASADTEIAFLNAVYDYLIDTDASNELVPRLATGWEVSDDGLTYMLKIAEGVKFHNGDDLTPEDVIWTFDRLRDPDLGSAAVDLYANVESITPGDDNTVIFKLLETNPDFLYTLTDNHAVILQANAENIGSEFNGTGPFRLVSYAAEDRATLEANPDYFRGRPSIDGLEFIYFADNEAAVNALRGGVIQAVLRLDNASFKTLDESGGYNAVSVPTNGHDLVRLRADREPGNDERVRDAFKMATNRDAIFERIQLGYGALGRDNPIGPLYAQYYTEQFPLPEYNPQRARELLEEAGYPDGLEMRLYVPNAPGRPALAEVLAAQWAEAGIRVTIEVQEEAQYYSEGGWLDVDLGITPWGSRPVPQLYLDLAYKTGAMWNEAHFSDEELDRYIERAGSTLDEQERVEAYHEIQRILIERGPVIIPYFFAQFGIFAGNVGGVEVHPFAGRTNFNRATLA